MSLCTYYHQQLCSSCSQLSVPYEQQLIEKQKQCAMQLPIIGDGVWLPIQESQTFAFRNKAKMVVSGSAKYPVLGIIDPLGKGVDLSECPLYPEAIQAAFKPIKHWIMRCQLAPYDIQKRSGELKYVLITYSASLDQLMVRFVLRTTDMLNVMRQQVEQLQQSCPNIAVVSVNIQPVPMAVVEGKEEYLLSSQDSLTMVLNGLPMHLKPQSFFQTNDVVSAALYRQAQAWIQQLQPIGLWDLFCGVGGFALHAAQVMTGSITGIEVSEQAIASASRSAQELGFSHLQFRALSADDFALVQSDVPEMVIVNPPRRGIGGQLCQFLNNASTLKWLIYSSCNPASLSKDLTQLDRFKVMEARVFDMFPHTEHAEVMVLLSRI